MARPYSRATVDISFELAVLVVGALLLTAAALSGWLRGTVLSISVLSVAAGIVLAELDVVGVDPGAKTVVYVVELALVLTLFSDGLLVEDELLRTHWTQTALALVVAAVLGGLALALAASCFACAALGLCVGSLTFRARSISVFADAISAALLLVTGANVPLERLPDVLQFVSGYIPLTHGLHAARELAIGAPVMDVLPQIRDELLVGAAYFVAGLLLLRYFERDGRRAGSFERF